LKKVLIITYHFPPNRSPAGLRPTGLAKYLPEYGWEPVVLTPRLPGRMPLGFKIVETPYRDTFRLPKIILGVDAQQDMMPQLAQLKKKLHIRSERSFFDYLMVTLGEVTAYPDARKGWRVPAVKTGTSYVRQEPVEAMISTSCYTSHIVAADLKRLHGIAWVADFQDLWTLNHYYPYSRLRKWLETRLEVQTLAGSDALVIASEHTAGKMRELHKGKSVRTITNAFDPADINNPPAALTKKFTITYTGNTFSGRQSPTLLFIALAGLIAEGAIEAGRVEVRFYGAEAGWIQKEAERYGLENVVRQFGTVPREEALEKQRESQVLLMLKWNDPTEKGIYSSKVFEYLAARRPILAVGGYPDAVSDLLNETGAGVDASTKDDVLRALKQMLDEYRREGGVAYRGEPSKVDRYSFREMARRYAEVLGHATQQNRPANG